jgi:hypothetical protein
VSTPPSARAWLPLAAIAGVATLLLAGCGGGGGADANGFTASQRSAARTVLTELGQTSIYDIALKTSLTQAEVPTTCVVHIQSTNPLTFEMFLSWVPNPEALGNQGAGRPSGYLRAYSWLQAVVGASGLKGDYSFHSGNELTEAAMRAHYGDVFTKPVANCLVLQNRKFGLLPPA